MQISNTSPTKSRRVLLGILAFVLVLLFMPLGHALMIINEWLPEHLKLVGAGAIGILGSILLLIGIRRNENKTLASMLGMVGGILVWTGWIEFSFVWIADRLSVSPLIQNDEVVTKPEYLIMPSSLGLLGACLLYFVFSNTKCQLFVWTQKLFGIRQNLQTMKSSKPYALITFMETVMIIWFFYILLLLIYDDQILGDRHPVTAMVAIGSLIWSVILFMNLLRIRSFDYAIRYAIPTVVIFWNVVEILGRWNFLKEIWIYPQEYAFSLGIMTLCLLILIFYFYRKSFSTMKARL
jgi:hypothetical protein